MRRRPTQQTPTNSPDTSRWALAAARAAGRLFGRVGRVPTVRTVRTARARQFRADARPNSIGDQWRLAWRQLATRSPLMRAAVGQAARFVSYRIVSYRLLLLVGRAADSPKARAALCGLMFANALASVLRNMPIGVSRARRRRLKEAQFKRSSNPIAIAIASSNPNLNPNRKLRSNHLQASRATRKAWDRDKLGSARLGSLAKLTVSAADSASVRYACEARQRAHLHNFRLVTFGPRQEARRLQRKRSPAQLGSAQLGSAWLGSAQLNPTQLNSTRLELAAQRLARARNCNTCA